MLKMRTAIMTALILVAPLPATAQPTTAQDPGIVVRGSRSEPSDWREAETDHVIVVSNGRESELRRLAHNLERLHFLLSVLLGRAGQPDLPAKLRVTLVGETAEFEAMDLKNLRSRQGPFARAFPIQRYYDPREDGAVMANTRIDQKIKLQQGQGLSGIDWMMRSYGPQGGAIDPSFFGAMSDPLAVTVNEVAVDLPAEGRLYAGYAQHYLMTYFPNAYPRWYLDGFGEIFATMRVRDDGAIDYGRPPEGYAKVTDWVRGFTVKDVLDGTYLDPRRDPKWTPYHAWVIAHYLFFSETRRGQLHAYLSAYAAGKSPAEAARVFGNMGKLQTDVARYDNSKIPYERMSYPPENAPEPILRRLTKGQAAFVKGRLELGSRVELPPLPPLGTELKEAERMSKERDKAIAARDKWLERLRADADRYSDNLDAQLLLAEAECRSGNAARCAAAADRALTIQPDSSPALAWKGTAMTQQALAGPASERAEGLRAARGVIGRANRADTEAVMPLLAYFRSYADAGETPPDVALEGLLKTIDTVPAAPAPRLLLGREFQRQGNRPAAARTLRPVADGPYDSPERGPARALLGQPAGK